MENFQNDKFDDIHEDIHLSEKRYGSKSWKIYETEIMPEIFKEYLNINEFIFQEKEDDDNKIVNVVTNRQELRKKVTELFSKSFIDLKKAGQINGWNYRRNKIVRDWKNKLEYLYVVNYYFMFELKKKESKLSWILIVISSICSFLTVSNTNDLIFGYLVTYCLSFLSITTALIAAFIKKENFVERIKNMDRYTQKIGKINTEIGEVLNSKPWNRITFEAFNDKYKEEIVNLFSYPPPISPIEFKNTVFKLTKYHTELINDTFPWFQLDKVGDIEYYKMTPWGKQVLNSYYNYEYRNFIKKCLCSRCCNNDNKNLFMNYINYNKNLIRAKK